MKKILLATLLLINFNTYAAGVTLLHGGDPSMHCEDGLEGLGCFAFTITSLPLVIVVDDEAVLSDDAMIQLSDEISGESQSVQMTEKMAKHFEVSQEELVETAKGLQNSELGLSFESLTEAFK